MRYYIHTYGCQMNIHESEKVAGILEYLGYTPCDDEKLADLVVFNTCCIRETAEQKIVGHIGRLKKIKRAKGGNMIVVVLGCMTQQNGVAQTLRQKYPFVDVILGTSNLHLLETAVLTAQRGKRFCDVSMSDSVHETLPATRTSYPNAWVNIIYGCNNFCTYCIVPHVRGRERSRKMTDILAEVQSLLDQGYKEITLLGQNVNSYGKDLGDGTTFAKLLEQIGQMQGKFRLRFMTSHPKDLTEDVIDAIAKYPNICNYVHLPVQSGSTSILKKMNRHYTRENYLQLVDKIKSKLPDVGITSDIMIGFPGETDQDFADTLDLVQKVGYSSAFCFVYSRRKGTPADTMEDQVSAEVKKARITTLISEQNKITRQISKSMQGNTYEILVEDVNAKYPNTYCGRTENGRLVNFESQTNLIGQFVDVKITKSQSATLWGELVK